MLKSYCSAPVVQRIERVPPKNKMQVQFPPGAPETRTSPKVAVGFLPVREIEWRRHDGAEPGAREASAFTGVSADTNRWPIPAGGTI